MSSFIYTLRFLSLLIDVKKKKKGQCASMAIIYLFVLFKSCITTHVSMCYYRRSVQVLVLTLLFWVLYLGCFSSHQPLEVAFDQFLIP